MSKLTRILSTGAALAAVAAIPASASAAPTVDGEFNLTSAPREITQGPDGNVWIALDGATNDLARVAPDGTVTEFNPANVNAPVGITTGPDGNLWVTQANEVAKFSPADPNGAEKFAQGDLTDPRGITSGPDGNLWTASADKVVRIPPANPAGKTAFTVAGMGARQIASGSDGNLWVADFGSQRVVKVTTAGDPTPYDVAGGGPQGIAAATDIQQVGYSNPNAANTEVGRVTPDGTVSKTGGVGAVDPFGMTYGADKAYWTANFASGELGRLTTGGQYSAPVKFSAGSGPRYVTAGPGNTLWASLETAKKVGRVTGVEEPAAPTGGQGGTATGTAPDGQTATTTAGGVRLSGVRIAKKVRRGAKATLRLQLSEGARVNAAVQGRRCRTIKRGKRVTRKCSWATRARSTAQGRAGSNKLTLPTQKLKAGRYRVQVSVTDAAGSTSGRLTAGFSVVAPKAKARR